MEGIVVLMNHRCTHTVGLVSGCQEGIQPVAIPSRFTLHSYIWGRGKDYFHNSRLTQRYNDAMNYLMAWLSSFTPRFLILLVYEPTRTFSRCVLWNK